MTQSTITETIDVRDRQSEIQETLDDLRGIIGSIEARAERLDEADGEDGDDQPTAGETFVDVLEEMNGVFEFVDDGELEQIDEKAFDTRRALEELYRTLKHEEKELENARDTIEAKVEEWGGSKFEIKSLTAQAGLLYQKNDLVRADRARNDKIPDEIQLGPERTRTIQIATKATPPDAPDHPRDYPAVIAQFLYESIDNLNTYGEASLEDFSL